MEEYYIVADMTDLLLTLVEVHEQADEVPRELGWVEQAPPAAVKAAEERTSSCQVKATLEFLYPRQEHVGLILSQKGIH